MRKTAVNFEAVRALGRDFPDLQESTMCGSAALKLGQRLVACLAIHGQRNQSRYVVRTDFETGGCTPRRRSGNVLRHGPPTATASSSCCPIKTCCWCCPKRVSWRWSGRPPISSTISRGSRRSTARPGTPGSGRRHHAGSHRRADGSVPAVPRGPLPAVAFAGIMVPCSCRVALRKLRRRSQVNAKLGYC
jgi:hypothetical protein